MGNCLGKKAESNDLKDSIDYQGGNVNVITSKESWDQKIKEATSDKKIVVANFSASWCGPCRMMAPIYAELSEKYRSLMFLTVDVDELVDIGTLMNIEATPTFVFLKDGQHLDKVVGANKSALEKMIMTFANSTHLGPHPVMSA